MGVTEGKIIVFNFVDTKKDEKKDHNKKKLRDKYGWPVVFIKGKLITNIIRAIIHTDIRKTLEG